MDSTCSYHMMPNKDWFDTYRLVNSTCSYHMMPNNDASCRVVGMGNIIVKMFVGVIRMLCDPNLRKNLISLGTL